MAGNNGIPNFDSKKTARAGTAAALRGVVALYVGYMIYSILKGTISGTSTLPVWAGWLVSAVFLAADLVFIFYIFKCYRADLEAARLPEQPEDAEVQEGSEAQDEPAEPERTEDEPEQ